MQEQGAAMQVLLSDACQQQHKPTIAFVGATIQPSLSHTASTMVSSPSGKAFSAPPHYYITAHYCITPHYCTTPHDCTLQAPSKCRLQTT